jgi:hypothetical protein
MPPTPDVDSKDESRTCTTEPLRPALASVDNSCVYLGGVSRSKLYADILPLLETVHIGSRLFIVVTSMDRVIESRKRPPAAEIPGRERDPDGLDNPPPLGQLVGADAASFLPGAPSAAALPARTVSCPRSPGRNKQPHRIIRRARTARKFTRHPARLRDCAWLQSNRAKTRLRRKVAGHELPRYLLRLGITKVVIRGVLHDDDEIHF